MRGAEGSPAILLLHGYGADRSWLLNFGVKLNETTNMTVLLPDMRGHGQNPPVAATGFGTVESDDALAALEFLRGLKSPQGRALVGGAVGVYGVELGAYAALAAARHDKAVRAITLDSVPDDADDILAGPSATARASTTACCKRSRGSARASTSRAATRPSRPARSPKSLGDRQVLLLSGDGAGSLKQTTETLANCFPSRANVETHTDLPLTGITLASASPEQDEAYDRRVIEFFDRTR